MLFHWILTTYYYSLPCRWVNVDPGRLNNFSRVLQWLCNRGKVLSIMCECHPPPLFPIPNHHLQGFPQTTHGISQCAFSVSNSNMSSKVFFCIYWLCSAPLLASLSLYGVKMAMISFTLRFSTFGHNNRKNDYLFLAKRPGIVTFCLGMHLVPDPESSPWLTRKKCHDFPDLGQLPIPGTSGNKDHLDSW